MSKVCAVCMQTLPLLSFSVNNATTDGRQRMCKECDREYQRQRRLKNPERSREAARKYREDKKDDHEWRLKQLLVAAKARSKTKGRDFELTLEELIELYPEDNKCPVFGFDLEWNSAGFRETSPSIDRIDSELGYNIENCQVISWKANRLKADATLDELKQLIAFLED